MSDQSKTYLCSYDYNGEQWEIEIDATSFEDARARLSALYYSGRVDGELIEQIVIPKLLPSKWVEWLAKKGWWRWGND